MRVAIGPFLLPIPPIWRRSLARMLADPCAVLCVVRCLPCAVCRVLCSVCRVLRAVCCVPCVLCFARCVPCLLCGVCCLLCVLCFVFCVSCVSCVMCHVCRVPCVLCAVCCVLCVVCRASCFVCRIGPCAPGAPSGERLRLRGVRDPLRQAPVGEPPALDQTVSRRGGVGRLRADDASAACHQEYHNFNDWFSFVYLPFCWTLSLTGRFLFLAHQQRWFWP